MIWNKSEIYFVQVKTIFSHLKLIKIIADSVPCDSWVFPKRFLLTGAMVTVVKCQAFMNHQLNLLVDSECMNVNQT